MPPYHYADGTLRAIQSRPPFVMPKGALGDRIERLQDVTEVEIVQHAYGYYVDKAQWRSLADLFADDATLEIGGKGIVSPPRCAASPS